MVSASKSFLLLIKAHRKGLNMDFKFLLSFVIAVGCYLLVVGLFALIKKYKNKKKVNKEIEEIEQNNESK